MTYGANLQARVLVKKEGEILMDVFITEELGVIRTDDVKIQMLESSLSTFHPSRCVPVHAMLLAVSCVLTERAVPALCLPVYKLFPSCSKLLNQRLC